MTEYHEPHTLAEAFELLQRYGDDAKVLAGGTALVLFMRQGLLAPGCLINIQHIGELAGITESGNGSVIRSTPQTPRSALQLGALTTHAQAAASPLIEQHYPALASTFRHVATPRIRNAGT